MEYKEENIMPETIVIPEGMLEAAQAVYNAVEWNGPRLMPALEAALLWLSKHPIVPTEADVMGLLQDRVQSGHITGAEYSAIPPTTVRFVVREWMRHCFLAPDEENQ